MDDEIEDMVGDVRLTDSQKSVATLFSGEFTDSTENSEKNTSSGQRTYVIDNDSDTSDQPFTSNQTTIYLEDKSTAPLSLVEHRETATKTTSIQRLSVHQEIYTQTSKTIMELATMDKIQNIHTLETQTSLIAITENKTIEYTVERSQIGSTNRTYVKEEYANFKTDSSSKTHKSLPTDGTSKYCGSTQKTEDSDSDKTECDSSNSSRCITSVTNGKSKGDHAGEERLQIPFDLAADYSSCSDMEEDSLMNDDPENSPHLNSSLDTSDVPKSIDNEVDELYKKLSETIHLNIPEKQELYEIRRVGILTPLTEESNRKSIKSAMDVTYGHQNDSFEDKDVMFINKDGFRVKLLPSEEKTEMETTKLPPIQKNNSCPNSPQLNYLFPTSTNKHHLKAGTLSSLQEGETDKGSSWGMRSRGDLASGESPFITAEHDSAKSLNESLHLPPINKKEKPEPEEIQQQCSSGKESRMSARSEKRDSKDAFAPISIKQKIKELKYSNLGWPPLKPRPVSTDEVGSTPDTDRLSSIAEKGCEALCNELMHRLRSTSWFEVSETLQDIPRSMEKFWGVISENRTAELIRLVITHLESPRTLVSRAACHTLAEVIKNTKYTKKPDFYEAMSALLVKTGCFSRAVKRAANLALDEIVCHVDYAHALTALCLHGVHHKSSAVRSAASRLLVVSSAVSGAGGALLRTRPARAATARQLTMQAMAELLDDKCADARKYAERLYIMLRPLPNFEAFYLTDVEIETATRQMKKYDQLLANTTLNKNR